MEYSLRQYIQRNNDMCIFDCTDTPLVEKNEFTNLQVCKLEVYFFKTLNGLKKEVLFILYKTCKFVNFEFTNLQPFFLEK